MRDHLSEDRLNEWMLGKSEGETSRHLEACPRCRHKADELAQTLGLFRDSIYSAAAGHNTRWRAQAESERQVGARRITPQWAYAAIVATILVISVALLRTHPRTIPSRTASTVSEDEILLQVQTDISQEVPDALSPGKVLLAQAEEALSVSSPEMSRGVRKDRRR